jgi:hypothetical protein
MNPMMRLARLMLVLLPAACGAVLAAEPEKPQNEWEQWGAFNPSYQMVFFAVLEGLYFDGVSNEAVDAIIPLHKDGYRAMTEHFVYACPLCAPVKDALNLYRARPPFANQKPIRWEETSDGRGKPIYRDTFGKGLDAETMAALKSDKKSVRLEALRALVQKWVQRRMELQRLTADEKKEWAAKFEKMSKDGEKLLKEWTADGDRANAMGFDYKGWTDFCPSCSGAVKGVEMLKPVKKE